MLKGRVRCEAMSGNMMPEDAERGEWIWGESRRHYVGSMPVFGVPNLRTLPILPQMFNSRL